MAMSKKERELIPGQVERIDLNMEQAECLASVVRSEVFWSVSTQHPSSIAEIAAALDRPANTTTYHVNELVRVGLLMQAGERMAKTRREKLYVKAARWNFHRGADAPREYRDLYVQSFMNLIRSMGRETETVNDVVDFQPDIADFRILRRYSFRINRERSLEFKRRISEAISEFTSEDDPDGVRVSTVFYISPTLGESRARLKKRKKT
jgi:predicted transcriptional regulator